MPSLFGSSCFRARWTTLALTLVSAAATAHAQGGGEAPPNVLIVLADDLGYGDVGAFGSQTIATPNIDALCADGARMTSFYAHPTCSPSRAALLTGRYAQRVGLPGPIGTWSQRGLSPDEVTIAEVLSPAGYTSAQFGKWHVGDAPEQQPTGQGFDEFRGLLWGPTGIPLVLRDSVLDTLEYEPDLADDFADVTGHSIDFIQRAVTNGSPFFCIASYVAPHEPATASPAFQGVSADGRDYGDSVEELDHSIGILLSELTTLGIDSSTLVIFLSDNGATYQRIPYQDGSNLPFADGKGTTFEGGVRVPAGARWTGKIPPGLDIDAPLSITDLLPTIAAYGGVTLDPMITIDGQDIGPVLEGGPADPTRVVHLASGIGFDAVRRGRYKLRQGQLFDLETDPEELVDLSATLPIEAAELSLELDGIIADVAADNRPASLSSRFTGRFRGDFGLPSAPVDGEFWQSISLDDASFLYQDVDPIVDAARIEIPDLGTANTPRKALHLPALTDEIRLIGNLPQLDPLGAFTVTFWYRPVAGTAAESLALLDVGDGDAGLSITIGDGGVAGDDTAIGRRDDLLVRVGGLNSPGSGTIVVDLPDAPNVEFLSLAVVRDDIGDLIVYVNGFEQGRVLVAGVDAGLDRTWSVLAPLGAMGGADGPGVLPFAATRAGGDLAGIGVVDRALALNEVQSEYARFTSYIYCQGRANATGLAARFSLSGSFRRQDDLLFTRVTDLPPGTVGYLVASLDQHRTNIADGTLCIAGQILRLSKQVYFADSFGEVNDTLSLGVAPPPVLVSTSPIWNFQFWYRDGAASNFSNGLNVLFAF